jgi:hypothetical protein
MKPLPENPCIPAAIVLLILAVTLSTGCTAEPAKIPGTTPAVTAAVVTVAGPDVTSLPYGVGLTLPAQWTRKDVLTSDIRDYGKRSIRIATFSSPVTIPGDAASVNTLDIDLDQSPGDFEAYFNQATLATGKTYGTNLDAHSIVKSSTLTISGYKSYELDFQTSEVKGSYIFTSTQKGLYIFAFRGENKPVAVHALEGEIADILGSIRITPSDT